MSMLIVRGLRSGYGKIEVLHELSLTVEQGQIVALIGANGAGKTTLLKTISGLIRPAAGEIEFAGTSIARRPAHNIVALGLSHVPEGRAILKRMSVLDNLRMGAYVRTDREVGRDIAEALGRFPVLAERRNQMAGALSGGEQQMLAIARAVVGACPQIGDPHFPHPARVAAGRQNHPPGRTKCPLGPSNCRSRACHGTRENCYNWFRKGSTRNAGGSAFISWPKRRLNPDIERLAWPFGM